MICTIVYAYQDTLTMKSQEPFATVWIVSMRIIVTVESEPIWNWGDSAPIRICIYKTLKIELLLTILKGMEPNKSLIKEARDRT